MTVSTSRVDEHADPRAAFLDAEENRRTNRRAGSMPLTADDGHW
jgi:hypothetical protein